MALLTLYFFILSEPHKNSQPWLDLMGCMGALGGGLN
jgi:hypothetical protein